MGFDPAPVLMEDRGGSPTGFRRQAGETRSHRDMDRMAKRNQQLRGVTADVLALVCERRKGADELVLRMSDLELGLQSLPGSQVIGRRQPHPWHCVQLVDVRFRTGGPSAPTVRIAVTG
jgi:hypothetical protein